MVDGLVDFMLSVPNMESFVVVLALVSLAAVMVKKRLRKLELQLEDESEVLFAGYFSFPTVCRLVAGIVMGSWFLLLSIFGLCNGNHRILHLAYCALFFMSGAILLYISNIFTLDFLVITEKYCFKYGCMGLASGKKYALKEMRWEFGRYWKGNRSGSGMMVTTDDLFLYCSGRSVAKIRVPDYAYYPFFVDCIAENIRPA